MLNPNAFFPLTVDDYRHGKRGPLIRSPWAVIAITTLVVTVLRSYVAHSMRSWCVKLPCLN
jgi:hypothetical protein